MSGYPDFLCLGAKRRVYPCLLVADVFPNNSVLAPQRVQHGNGGIVARAQQVLVRKPFPEPSLSWLDFRCAVGAYVGATGDHFSPPARQCDATRSTVLRGTKFVRCLLDLLFSDQRFFRSDTADQ